MVPTQDALRFAAPLSTYPSIDLLPAAIVAAVMLAMITALLLVAVRRRDAD